MGTLGHLPEQQVLSSELPTSSAFLLNLFGEIIINHCNCCKCVILYKIGKLKILKQNFKDKIITVCRNDKTFPKKRNLVIVFL